MEQKIYSDRRHVKPILCKESHYKQSFLGIVEQDGVKNQTANDKRDNGHTNTNQIDEDIICLVLFLTVIHWESYSR